MSILLLIVCFVVWSHNVRNSMANGVTLESLRQSLIRQEDTIIFSLIDRARFPTNSPTYNESNYVSTSTFSGSLVHFVVEETEALQAKVCGIKKNINISKGNNLIFPGLRLLVQFRFFFFFFDRSAISFLFPFHCLLFCLAMIVLSAKFEVGLVVSCQ